jgi:hypothetical protein
LTTVSRNFINTVRMDTGWYEPGFAPRVPLVDREDDGELEVLRHNPEGERSVDEVGNGTGEGLDALLPNNDWHFVDPQGFGGVQPLDHPCDP